MNRKEKTCPTCNGSVHGRKDKVFCSINCKNEHHKIARIVANKSEGLRNKRIKRNYTVLLGILGVSYRKVEIHRDELFKYGFDVNAFMSTVGECFQIFQFKFRKLKNGIIEIVRKGKPVKMYKEFIERWKKEYPDGMEMELGTSLGGGMKYFRRYYDIQTSGLTAMPFKKKEMPSET